MVHDNELHCSCFHVLLLHTESSRDPGATIMCHVHHNDTDPANGNGHLCQCLGVPVDAGRDMFKHTGEHILVDCDVLKLSGAFLQLLL